MATLRTLQPLGRHDDLLCHTRRSTGFAVRARNDDDISVGITNPDVPMSWGRVYMRFFDNLDMQCTGPFDGGIKVVDLEPEQDAVPWSTCLRINQVRMILHVPRVELENQVTLVEQSIV
jgi:hypothetical protein